MNRIAFTLFLIYYALAANCQENSFKFGQVSQAELYMKSYVPDTSAYAVVLNEFGEAYVKSEDNMYLAFEYHVKIKILKPGGLDKANFSIPLIKLEKEEHVMRIHASSFTLVDGVAIETKLDPSQIFRENNSKYMNYVKFAIPNVQVGSVIEVMYKIESPFIFKFRSWNFQDDIPKIRSEYWATIPANYNYNISLRGFLSLSVNKTEVIRDCYLPNGHNADCHRYIFAMDNIPAFVEEEYMTAASNFISAINFELMEVHYFNGQVDKITKEWKDVEEELRKNNKFGMQIKRGKEILDEKITHILNGETDSLRKAKLVYNFIKDWYEWNGVYGEFSEFGIRKAYENKRGNVGDINLSLVAALKYAGLDASPMLLSTRRNGLPRELFPVITDFNYVIAKLNIGDNVYLLDATEDHYPFGMLPERCLNGKGRVLEPKLSYWYDLNSIDKKKKFTILYLKLDEDGVMRGTIQKIYYGYDAVNQRARMSSFNTEAEYIKDLDNNWPTCTIKGFQIDNSANIEKPVTEKLDVELEAFNDLKAPTLFLNPFITDRRDQNPFLATARLFPVDFATPFEEVMVLNLELPPSLQLAELPRKVALALPNSGGRYVYQVEVDEELNKVTVNHSLVISRAIFLPEEYQYLKELFARVIQLQNADLVLSHRK